MAETHRLAPASDRATTTGDNDPPADPFLAGLQEKHGDLISMAADLEMEAVKLPKEVKSDDDVAAISAWVVRSRKLNRDTEATRKRAGEDLLVMTKTLNGFFNGIRTALENKATAMEQRSAPYLAAKRQAEEARKAAEAAAAQAEANRLAAEAEAARQRQAAAQAAAAAEAQRIRDAEIEAERAKLKADAGAEAFAERDSETAQEAMRVAGVASLKASEEAEEAAKAAEAAAAAATKASQLAAGGYKLSRTAGGGAAATVKETFTADVFDRQALRASCGPIGGYLSDLALDDALARAARLDIPPAIPGVDWISSLSVNTRALRK